MRTWSRKWPIVWTNRTYLLWESTQTNSSALVIFVLIVSKDECLISLRTTGSELSEPALALEYVLVDVWDLIVNCWSSNFISSKSPFSDQGTCTYNRFEVIYLQFQIKCCWETHSCRCCSMSPSIRLIIGSISRIFLYKTRCKFFRFNYVASRRAIIACIRHASVAGRPCIIRWTISALLCPCLESFKLKPRNTWQS